ncbi:MAG TPA: low-specificity L-threonine aldolase [Dehalococcoidia bacterium]|nr:low-specificity L-threonine aldolase [Dehalococcoidia bacterium]
MSEPRIIDLRSDTVTVPSDEMRRAIATAPVGDDVFGEDPTVRRLEAIAAERTGKEAAVFVASGTMSNLVAIMAHCARGDEAIVGSEAHILHYEVAGAAAVAGVQLRPVPNDARGRIDPDGVQALIRAQNVHMPQTALLCLENTHNRCGGAVLSADDTAALAEVAHRNGVRVHIDGARIFNAALAANATVADLAAPADSVGFCLSKGLGAPVGSVLCGSSEFVARARKMRKTLGGGMRQAGIIAAAGVYALEHMVDRLAEDHANAKLLARGLADLPMVQLDPDTVETNIVIFGVRGDAAGLVRAFKQQAVLATMPGPDRIRMVTHYGIARADIDDALERLRNAAAAVA